MQTVELKLSVRNVGDYSLTIININQQPDGGGVEPACGRWGWNFKLKYSQHAEVTMGGGGDGHWSI